MVTGESEEKGIEAGAPLCPWLKHEAKGKGILSNGKSSPDKLIQGLCRSEKM